jgi:ABC-type phosphate transport system substrate-binding protein
MTLRTPLIAAIGLTVLLPELHDRPSILAQAQSIASDAIAIIVHRSNTVDALSMTDLRRIFMLDMQSWPNGRRITLILRAKGQPERAEVIRLITRISEADYDRHLLYQTFRGSVGWGPRSILSAHAMLRFVFNAPGAIGYVPADETNDTIKVLRIDERLPGDPRYPLKRLARPVQERSDARR